MAIKAMKRPPVQDAARLVMTTVKPRPGSQAVVGHPEFDTPMPARVRNSGSIHLVRLDGVGDMLFMEPAIRKLKAQCSGQAIILHTRARYTDMAPAIGFDAAEVCENKSGSHGSAVNLNWALEQHAASHVMDRVSIWEDILRVGIGDEPVSIAAVASGKALLASHPQYHSDRPSLYFSPFSAYRDRSIPAAAVTEAIPILLSTYNVVLTAPAYWDKTTALATNHPNATFIAEKAETISAAADAGALVFPETTVLDWFALAGACDVALSSDTGGMYVAASAGVPTVGLFEHVPPWLRLRRFPGTRGVLLRGEGCRCDHHGPCNKPREECRDLLTPEFIANQIEAVLAGETGYFLADGSQVAEPLLQIDIEEGHASAIRATEFSAREACRGLNFRIGPADKSYGSPSSYRECRIVVKAGDMLNRDDVWAEFTRQLKG